MSLLDDVSIVVTPNGYKAGTLFGVIPVPTVGTEEVVNGDFATDTDWTKGTGWTISGGTANANTSGSYINFYQNNVFTIGKAYQYEFTILNYSQGEVRFTQGGVDISGVKNANGTYTGVFSASQTSLYFQGVSSFIGSIDNVSVKEWTGADMDVTRATAATRVDEAGLVNYAEVVSDTELVSNGDFEIASGDVGGFWTTGAGWAILGNGLATRAATGTNFAVDRDSFLTINQTYKVVIVVQVVTSGNVKVVLGATNSPEFTAAGTYTFIGVQTNNTKLRISPSNDYVGSVSNISVKEVTRDNVPRIDYTGGGCPHILAEPQRTNLITYSEDFSSWTGKQSSITLTSNSTISPNGLQDATKIVFSDNSQTQLFQYVTAVSGTVYATSVFVKYKSGTDRNITIGVYDSGFKTIQLNFNTDGTIASTSTSGTLLDSGYEDYGNGWYRAYIVHTGATTGNIEAQINRVGLSNTVEEFYIWGEQLEVGSFPTSYIPTSGSTVTRNQDQFSRDGIGSLIGQTEGTFFIELSKPVLNFSTQSLISLNNAASNSDANSIAIGFDTGDDFFIRLQSNNVLVFQETETNADTNTFYKVAISYKSGESLMYLNGSPLTPTSGNLSNAFTFAVILDNLSFDFRGDGALPFFGKVKQLQVYKTALTDTQLAALTS